MNKKYVLWLPSWYPNKTNIFDGDFIERHSDAVSELTKIVVLFVVKDENIKQRSIEIEKVERKNITIYKAYYGKVFMWSLLEKLLSLIRYFYLQKKLYRQIEKEYGRPQIVHVHVAMKAGLLALWLQKKYSIPFVTTEHWSGYRLNANPNIYTANWLFKLLNKKVLANTNLFLPVSVDLGNVVNKNFINIPYSVVSNVVNTSLFYYNNTSVRRFRFLHPSSMNYIKNPEGILHACKMVKDRGYEFELLMVGNQSEELICLAKTLKISDIISIENAVPYNEVAKLMQQSSALLMFSRFENLPCVILEALCCGLPVISSNVGGVPEIIDERNGILVDSDDIETLAIAMIKMIENYSDFDQKEISEKATRLYNYQKVATDYFSVYNKILAENSQS